MRKERTLWVNNATGSSAIVAALVVLSGCAGTAAINAPDTDSSGANNAPSAPGETPEADNPAEFYPELKAATNLPYFEHTLAQNGAGSRPVSVQELIDALIDGGFPASSIEVTPENSQIALPADSVSVAVLFHGECLIGQYTDGWLAVDVVAALPDETCLVLERETLD